MQSLAAIARYEFIAPKQISDLAGVGIDAVYDYVADLKTGHIGTFSIGGLRGRPSRSMLCFPRKAAYAVLEEDAAYYGIDPSYWLPKRWHAKPARITARTGHMADIAEDLVAAELSARSGGVAVNKFWTDYRAAEIGRIYETADLVDSVSDAWIRPDAAMMLRIGGGDFLAFLETDNRTYSIQRLGEKLKGYWTYLRSGNWRRKYGYGEPSFAVLIVTTTPQCVGNILERIDWSELAPIHEIQPSDVFFLTDRTAAHRDFFGGIWRRPGMDGLFSWRQAAEKAA